MIHTTMMKNTFKRFKDYILKAPEDDFENSVNNIKRMVANRIITCKNNSTSIRCEKEGIADYFSFNESHFRKLSSIEEYCRNNSIEFSYNFQNDNVDFVYNATLCNKFQHHAKSRLIIKHGISKDVRVSAIPYNEAMMGFVPKEIEYHIIATKYHFIMKPSLDCLDGELEKFILFVGMDEDMENALCDMFSLVRFVILYFSNMRRRSK